MLCSKKLSKKGIIGVSGYFLARPPSHSLPHVCRLFLHQADNQDEEEDQDQDGVQDDHRDHNQDEDQGEVQGKVHLDDKEDAINGENRNEYDANEREFFPPGAQLGYRINLSFASSLS